MELLKFYIFGHMHIGYVFNFIFVQFRLFPILGFGLTHYASESYDLCCITTILIYYLIFSLDRLFTNFSFVSCLVVLGYSRFAYSHFAYFWSKSAISPTHWKIIEKREFVGVYGVHWIRGWLCWSRSLPSLAGHTYQLVFGVWMSQSVRPSLARAQSIPLALCAMPYHMRARARRV